MATFTYTPSTGAAVDHKPAVRQVKFGDGYEQRLAAGLNTDPEMWRLEFRGLTTSTATAIDNFLKARNAVETFDWLSPSGTAAKFVCPEWSRSFDEPNVESIRATFVQVFEP